MIDMAPAASSGASLSLLTLIHICYGTQTHRTRYVQPQLVRRPRYVATLGMVIRSVNIRMALPLSGRRGGRYL